MSSTTFSNGTVIPVDWLNEVNALLWGSASPPATPIRVNTSNNVGIGVTPNTNWRVGANSMQLGTFTTLHTASNGATSLGFGLYEGGTNTYNYLTTGDAPCLYQQITGRHLWYNASSGTAGNTASLTQRMELDSSGNFAVATTPTTNRVTIRHSGASASPEGSSAIYINTGATAGNAGLLLGADSTNNLAFIQSVEPGTSYASKALWVNKQGGPVYFGAVFGYGTGNSTGSSVTQLTSKSTAVTINTPTGAITMNNAALGAGASVGFLVNNTSVSSTDLVLINTAGVTWGNYRIEAYNVTGGSFSVRLTNLSAGSLSDAVVFNFAVIKGSST